MNDNRPFLPPSADEQQRRAARDFIHACRWLAAAGPDNNAEAMAVAGRATDRIVRTIKAAIGPTGGTLAGSDALAAYANVSGAWLAGLRRTGVFDRMLGDMRQAPMLQRFGVNTTTWVADEIVEGAGKPVMSVSINGADPLRPRKTAAIAVLTRELARFSDAESLLDTELRNGVVAGVDTVFLADMLAAVTPGGSTSSVADIDALLEAVPLGTASRPYFILASDVARIMSTERAGNIRLWPDLAPLGGEISGIPALVTDRIADGTTMLIDASAIAANGGEVQIATSTVADVQMVDNPTVATSAGSPAAPVAAQLVSLFQSNGVALRAERTFSFRLLRSNAVAAVTGGGSP